jgi:hypothetical protein
MQSAKVIESSSEEEIRFVRACQGKSHIFIDYLHLINHS